jgi:hypothetical protein
MPDDCGSTTVSAIWMAMAASAALPPWFRIQRPRLRGTRIGRGDHSARRRRAGRSRIG